METNGTVVVVGSFSDTVNFDPNGNNGDGDLTSVGSGNNLFVLQLNQL